MGETEMTRPAAHHNFVIHKRELMENKTVENNVSPPIQYALIVCTSRVLINDIMLLQIQAGCIVNVFSPCSNTVNAVIKFGFQ